MTDTAHKLNNKLSFPKSSLGTHQNREKIITYLVEKLKEVMEKYGYSQNQLSSSIGISGPVLSQILNYEYEYNPDNYVWMQVYKFIEHIDRKIYKTKLYRYIHRLFDICYTRKKLSVITSKWGTGKTLAAEQYCLQNPNAVFIRYEEIFTKKYMLQRILEALGNVSSGLKTTELYDSICSLLNRKEKLLIIDEADRLDAKYLHMLRDIYDRKNAGLVLMGSHSLRDNLLKGKNLKDDLGALTSRVIYPEEVDIFEPEDVRMIFDDKFPRHKIGYHLIKKISKEYRMNGAFRFLIDKLCNKIDEAIKINKIKNINDELVQECISQLKI